MHKKVVIIESGTNLSMGEKLKIIRTTKKISQRWLASQLSITGARLSQLELGESSGFGEVNSDTFVSIRTLLGVEELPLNEFERESYKEKLLELDNLTSSRNFKEAKELRDKLAIITFAPFDEELNVLFNLYDCRLSILHGDADGAEKTLNRLAHRYQKHFKQEQWHLYYRNKASICIARKQHHDALELMTKAFELRSLTKPDIGLHLSMGMRCYYVGMLRSSIMYMEKALELCESLENNTFERSINIMLVRSYIGLNDLADAKKLLDKLYEQAKNSDDRQFICDVLTYYSYMYRCAGSYSTSHGYSNEAMIYTEKKGTRYLEILYHKARCYLAEGGYTACSKLLEEGMRLSEDDENYTILFESLGHLMTLKNDESLKYLETVAIPHLLNEEPVYTTALDYCEILQKHYEQKSIGTIKKALEIEKIITHILRRHLRKGEIK